jgi:hypothetical protein
MKNKLTMISRRTNGVPALGIGICGYHGTMIGVYKVSPSGRIGDQVYRHNLKTGGVMVADNPERYPVNIPCAVESYISAMTKAACASGPLTLPPAYRVEEQHTKRNKQ